MNMFKHFGGIHCRPAKPLPKVGLPADHTLMHYDGRDFFLLIEISTEQSENMLLLSNVIVYFLQDMEEFAQSSGDAGIVVFALGLIFKKSPNERHT